MCSCCNECDTWQLAVPRTPTWVFGWPRIGWDPGYLCSEDIILKQSNRRQFCLKSCNIALFSAESQKSNFETDLTYLKNSSILFGTQLTFRTSEGNKTGRDVAREKCSEEFFELNHKDGGHRGERPLAKHTWTFYILDHPQGEQPTTESA